MQKFNAFLRVFVPVTLVLSIVLNLISAMICFGRQDAPGLIGALLVVGLCSYVLAAYIDN